MKKKKKEKHKEKKHKKSKKSKHKKYSSDSSESEDEWEEAGGSTNENLSKVLNSVDVPTKASPEHKESIKRDDWMTGDSLFDVACSSTNMRENKTKEKKMEIKRKEEEKNQEIYNARELNPHRKADQSGGETVSKVERRVSSHTRIGDGGNSWIHKAFERAKERAKQENIPLENIVKERWGSMQKLEALLKTAERGPRSTSSTSKKAAASGWRKYSEQPKIDSKILSETSIKTSNVKDDNRSEEPLTKHETRNTDEEIVPNESLRNRNAPNERAQSEKVSKETPLKKTLTEEEKNEINAKILRAELMGNDDLVAALKVKLDGGDTGACEMKPDKSSTRKRKDNSDEDSESSGNEEIILTRSDKHGNLYPVKLDSEENPKARRKKKIMSTHDKESGDRVRYFEDDDNTDLKTMVEHERLTSADDQQAMLARLAGKHLGKTMGDDYTVDDMFVQASATKGEVNVENRRVKAKAIAEDKLQRKQLASCRFCFENPNIAKHLIISIGTTVYISLPINASLTENHCLIIPMRHVAAQTFLDENVIEEISKFKKALTRMFSSMNEDVMFLETCKNLRSGRHHCVIECIPVPKEVGDMAPIYFKKAITETGSEWSDNKKLITVTAKNGVSNTIPKGLPYFSVEFGLDGGFGHIIEEESFPYYFGKEIIGGMMDLEPRLWLKPPKESFELHKRKVFKFTDCWKEFDCTSELN